MGSIHIEGMEFYAYHGHFEEERIVGNRFLVDLTMETAMDKPNETDNLVDAVDYQKAYKIIAVEMEKKSALLENIAGRIIKSLSSELDGMTSCTVKISKLNPPLGGKVNSVSVIQKWQKE